MEAKTETEDNSFGLNFIHFRAVYDGEKDEIPSLLELTSILGIRMTHLRIFHSRNDDHAERHGMDDREL